MIVMRNTLSLKYDSDEEYLVIKESVIVKYLCGSVMSWKELRNDFNSFHGFIQVRLEMAMGKNTTTTYQFVWYNRLLALNNAHLHSKPVL